MIPVVSYEIHLEISEGRSLTVTVSVDRNGGKTAAIAMVRRILPKARVIAEPIQVSR